jgi:hypothetical protein
MTAATKVQDNSVEGLAGLHYASGVLYGTYTAANFTITLGFEPKKVRVVNLTDRVECIQYLSSVLDAGNNAKGLVRAANGDTTYAATGIVISGNTFVVTVATNGLQTDNDDVLYEAWG